MFFSLVFASATLVETVMASIFSVTLIAGRGVLGNYHNVPALFRLLLRPFTAATIAHNDVHSLWHGIHAIRN